MAIKLAIHDRLVAQAQNIGEHKTRDQAITAALQNHHLEEPSPGALHPAAVAPQRAAGSEMRELLGDS